MWKIETFGSWAGIALCAVAPWLCVPPFPTVCRFTHFSSVCSAEQTSLSLDMMQYIIQRLQERLHFQFFLSKVTRDIVQFISLVFDIFNNSNVT